MIWAERCFQLVLGLWFLELSLKPRGLPHEKWRLLPLAALSQAGLKLTKSSLGTGSLANALALLTAQLLDCK